MATIYFVLSLSDLDAPRLNASLQQTVKENSSLYVTCSSEVSPAATYRWMSASGKTISNSKVLSFAVVSRLDAGVYYCNATNIAGSKVSGNLNLDVQCK